MSTRIYRNVTVRVEEASAGNIQPLGWLPNDIAWPTTAGAADLFATNPGVNPLGYKSGGPAQGEVTFRPVDDGAIPSNATIDDVTYRLRLMWAKQNVAFPGLVQTATPFMVHQTSDGLDPETEVYTLIPPELTVTETPTSFVVEPIDATIPPTWVVRYAAPGDKSPFMTRFGLHYTGQVEAGPLVVYNAEVTVNFVLPVPEITTVESLWTISLRTNEYFAFTYDGVFYNVSIVDHLGTYTNGDLLAAAILTELQKTLNLNWTCTYDESTRQFTIGFTPDLHSPKPTITFHFGVFATLGPTIGFLAQDYSGAASYTSATNFPTQHPVENITRVRAMIHGSVNPNGATLQYPVTAYAEYAPSDGTGTRSTTTTTSLTGSTAQNVAFVMTDLLPGTEYVCRLVASNEDNVVYGAEEYFTTPEEDGVLFR